MAKVNKYPVIKAKTVIEVLETADSGTKMALERGSRYVSFEVRFQPVDATHAFNLAAGV